MLKLKILDWEVQGRSTSMIAEAKADGYSAVIELTKEPFGKRLPLKSIWSECVQCPASVDIRSEVAAMAHVLKYPSPTCMLEWPQNDMSIAIRIVGEKVLSMPRS